MAKKKKTTKKEAASSANFELEDLDHRIEEGRKAKKVKGKKEAKEKSERKLKESTGKEFVIKPVVVFPGWFVESKNHNKHWVLNPKGLPTFIQNQKEILSQEDVKLAAYHLSRYIRAL